MRRLSLILVTLFAFACAGFAQKSGGTSSGGTSAGTGTSTGASAGTVTGGTTAATPTTGTQTPLAPANPTTFNPGNPSAPTGGAPMVPGSSVPTATSDQDLNTVASGNGVVGGSASGGPVVQTFHLELQPSGAEVAVPNEPGTGSPMLPSTAPVAAPESESGPTIIDLAGMTYVNGNLPLEQVDNRSLGEIAAQYKRQKSVQAAHVYTNEDIERLNARNDVNVMGPNQNAALPQGEGAPAQQQQPATRKNQKRSPFTPRTPQHP